MAVEFRNTISSVFSALFTHMKQLESPDPIEGSTVPLRKVAEGESLIGGHPLASVTLQLLGAKIVGRSDVDKQWQQKLKISIDSAITLADGATDEILSKISQVEDKIEAFTKPDGVAGLEDAEWSITFATSVEHGNVVSADSTRVFTVMVSRGAN